MQKPPFGSTMPFSWDEDCYDDDECPIFERDDLWKDNLNSSKIVRGKLRVFANFAMQRGLGPDIILIISGMVFQSSMSQRFLTSGEVNDRLITSFS
jgi:hypothetical protein